MIHQVNTFEEFRTLVEENKHRLLVVDFTASWCGPCRRIAPWFENRASELGERAHFVKIDVDVNQKTAAVCAVSAMPTFVFIVDTRIVDTFKGANENAIEALIQKHINAPIKHVPLPTAAPAIEKPPPSK